MLGAFDGEKIAFIPYNDIHEVFYINDFNWNVTPSNYDTKEFKLIHEKVKTVIQSKALLFDFINDDRELKKFIKRNFIVGKFGLTKTKIDKNNFMVIYNKWLNEVKSTIAVNWDIAKKTGIIDGDFYLADLLSQENNTLKEKLFVLLKNDHYELDRKLDEAGMFSSKRTEFTDKQVAHTQFWNKYDRPPKEEYWDYIVERRDLLVPQDVRERKGSYFTPQIWVELSQKYLTDVLKEDWQDEYYIWDCAYGTGNLLSGLTNKYNIWASTLDKQDVEVMHDRIRNGANLLDDHVFQFDFLNDDFSKLPRALQEVINNPDERKKLVVYINPPYAEGDTHSENKVIRKGVALSKTYEKYKENLGEVVSELFIQFLGRIYLEIPDCTIATFSTLKYFNSPKSKKFRNLFKARAEKGFITVGNTFDNVIGNFPIGFIIWNLRKREIFRSIECDVYNKDGELIGKKRFVNFDDKKFLNDWLKLYYDKTGLKIGALGFVANDFQNQKLVFITTHGRGHHETSVTQKNLIEVSIYFAVRHCLEHTWVNHNDQFLYPKETWKSDIEFHNDCLTFCLFFEKNQIKANDGTNHWIPFAEQEVNAREKFESNFMNKFINGKIKIDSNQDLFRNRTQRTTPLKFSAEATQVFESARKLWKYYHKQLNCDANASLYDIREYFQGRNESGKMNNKSSDETYMNLIGELKQKLDLLADKIESKVYEHEFLIG